MERKKLTCIGCPMGCQMEVELENGEILAVEGNTCPRGEAYARKELTAPTRILTSTVALAGSRSGARRVPCKTGSDVPKERLFACMEELRTLCVHAPVHIGDVLKANLAGTGADVVATKTVL